MIVQAESQEESLISSNSIPEFEDIEREYQAHLAAIGAEEKPKIRGKKRVIPSEEITTTEISEDEMLLPEQIEGIVCFPLDTWFARTEKKPLNNIERKAFSISCCRLANKYIPVISSRWKEEIGFAICISTIFFARMEVKSKEPEKKVEPEPKVG